ncbi:hypothetical protein MAR_035027 [Mya arenaria]|uniref:TLDc domain-containing protein n=1 Tax=Mya arenaria TaxID=6604 RepID=A0ABY7EMJ7_MYAAR|nr:hypothetical protein MAR_035027 [Mya arenaria]
MEVDSLLISAGCKNYCFVHLSVGVHTFPSAFRNKGINQGPTVTVVHNEHKSVYGGNASQSWTGDKGNASDQQAFLYQLQFSGAIKCNKYFVDNHSQALYDSACLGPAFGNGGHDLWTFQNATKTGDLKVLDDCNGNHAVRRPMEAMAKNKPMESES